MRCMPAYLREGFAALSALVGPLARVAPRVDPQSGRVAEHLVADLALPPLGAANILRLS